MTSHPSHRPVSALRARMIEDMRVRGFTEKTCSDYVRSVRAFAAFIGRSPDTATIEDCRGGHAAAPGGAWAEVKGGARHRIRRRTARLRGRRAQGRRYRFRTYATAGRTG